LVGRTSTPRRWCCPATALAARAQRGTRWLIGSRPGIGSPRWPHAVSLCAGGAWSGVPGRMGLLGEEEPVGAQIGQKGQRDGQSDRVDRPRSGPRRPGGHRLGRCAGTQGGRCRRQPSRGRRGLGDQSAGSRVGRGDVLGDLDPRLDATFDGSASAPSGPYTELTGYVRDQAQFMGMIGQVADLGLDLVSASVCPCVDGERCEHLGEGLRPAEDHN